MKRKPKAADRNKVLPVTRSRPIVLAVSNDQHANSSVALSAPTVTLDDGQTISASKHQRWLWEKWNEFYAKADDTRRELNAEYIQVFNGDLVEGFHHGTVQLMSQNPNIQKAVVSAILEVPYQQKADRMLFVRGTTAHVGKSASSEESIAMTARADGRGVISDPDTGTASWWHFRGELQGVRLDITHHGRTGQREHTRMGAAALHAHDILLSHVKNGEQPPHLCLRAHYHRFNDSHDACAVRVVTNGAWQFKTEHTHKIAADSLADIGGLIVVIDGGEYEVRKVKFPYSRGTVWRPE